MDEEYGARTRDWVVLVRSMQLGKVVKSVALALAHYADSDGTRIFPGNARLAVECELSYNTVKATMARLREIGLIEPVRRAATSYGRAEEYRLIVGPDVLEHVKLLSPIESKALIDAMKDSRRGKYTAKLRPVTGTAETPALDNLRPVRHAADESESIDVDDLRHVPQAAETPDPMESAARPTVADEPSAARPTVAETTLRHVPRPPTKYLPATISTAQPPRDLDTDLKVVDAPASDLKIEVLPVRCPHKIRAQRRPDGSSSCALCRVGSKLAAEGSPLTTSTGTFRIVPRGATA